MIMKIIIVRKQVIDYWFIIKVIVAQLLIIWIQQGNYIANVAEIS